MPYISEVDIKLEDQNFKYWIKTNSIYLKYIYAKFEENFNFDYRKDPEMYFYYLLFINTSKNLSKQKHLLFK